MNMRNLLLAASAIALPTIASAQPVTGPYVSLGAGVDFLQNEVTRPASPFFSGPAQSQNYRFAPGYAGEVSVGYGLGNGFRFEVEGDYANNHLNSVGNATPVRSGGYVQQYGGFVNGIYDFDLGLPVMPYIGAGVGYQEVELDGINFGPAGVNVGSRTRQNGGGGRDGAAAGRQPCGAALAAR